MLSGLWSRINLTLVSVTLATLLASCSLGSGPSAPAGSAGGVSSSTPPRIIALGDSLTAGYGLDVSESYPSQLQQKLTAEGYSYRVENA